MTKTITAAELIAARRAELRADNARMAQRPAGWPRYDWRVKHPTPRVEILARDTALKTRPVRLLTFDLSGQVDDLWVWSRGQRPRVLARLDLRSPDADAHLRRYERVDA
jgi:hypothetical protein